MRSWRGRVVGSAALVFALAVGVILGSGPLRTALVGGNADEAEGLRAELADREAQLAEASDSQQILTRYLDEATGAATAGMLAEVKVAIVIAPGVDADSAQSMTAAVTESGGVVVATVTLGEAWLDENQVAFRAALAEEIVADVGVATEQTAPEAVLHAALAQVLVPSLAGASDQSAQDPELPPDTTLPQQQAEVLLDVLTRAGLVSMQRAPRADDGTVVEPTTVVLLTAPAAPDDSGYADDSAALIRLAGNLVDSQLRTVVAQGPRTAGDPHEVTATRTSGAPRFSVVADAWGPAGRLAVVLAAHAEQAGDSGLYGDPDRDRLLPGR